MGAKPYRKTVYERNQKQGGGVNRGSKAHTHNKAQGYNKARKK